MNDIEWIAEDDWTRVKVGDLVKCTLSLLEAIGPATYVNSLGTAISCKHWDVLKGHGWSLFVQAPPAIVLPTEPGLYLDNFEDVWRLESDGWYYGGNRFSDVAHYAPFIQLAPVPETAKKVLDAIARQAGFPVEDVWGYDTIAHEFGVTL